MAKIDIKANVIAPAEINVALVRADRASASNIFRLFFEVFLALSSTIVGAVITTPSPTHFMLIVLGVSIILTIAFAIISFVFGRPEKNG